MSWLEALVGNQNKLRLKIEKLEKQVKKSRSSKSVSFSNKKMINS